MKYLLILLMLAAPMTWAQIESEKAVTSSIQTEKAEEAKWRGKRMAMVFQAKINMNRESGMKNIM